MSDVKEHENQEGYFSDDENFRDEVNPVDADSYSGDDEDYPEDTVNLPNEAKEAITEKSLSLNEKELLEKLSEIGTANSEQQEQLTEILSFLNDRLKKEEQEQEKKELIRQDISDIQQYMFSELGINLSDDDPIIYSLLYNKSLFQNALTDYELALTRVTLDLDKKLKEIHDFSEKMQENKKQFLSEIVFEHTKQRRSTVGQIDKAIVDAVNLALEKAGVTAEQADKTVSELKTMRYLLLGGLAASILNFFI